MRHLAGRMRTGGPIGWAAVLAMLALLTLGAGIQALARNPSTTQSTYTLDAAVLDSGEGGAASGNYELTTTVRRLGVQGGGQGSTNYSLVSGILTPEQPSVSEVPDWKSFDP